MKELTLVDIQRIGQVLKRCVLDLTDVWILGSGAVSACHPELDGSLRKSMDVDMSPTDRPVYYFDSKFVEQYAGEESEFFEEHGFYLDYVESTLLQWTPPGWQQRVTTIPLTAGLRGHCLDPHDVAYNKLYAGRPKDIVWIRGLLKTGLITWARLEELHTGNPLAAVDREKVDQSIRKVKQEA